MFRWQAKNFHNAGKLFDFILAREQRATCVEFGQDTAQTPHVDRCTVWKAQNHFRATIKSGLKVCIYTLMAVTRGSEVYHLNRAATPLFQKHVFLQTRGWIKKWSRVQMEFINSNTLCILCFLWSLFIHKFNSLILLTGLIDEIVCCRYFLFFFQFLFLYTNILTGFKSQWIIFSRYSSLRQLIKELANRRIRLRLNPL